MLLFQSMWAVKIKWRCIWTTSLHSSITTNGFFPTLSRSVVDFVTMNNVEHSGLFLLPCTVHYSLQVHQAQNFSKISGGQQNFNIFLIYLFSLIFCLICMLVEQVGFYHYSKIQDQALDQVLLCLQIQTGHCSQKTSISDRN